jgi:hypothetical protein
VRSGDLGDQRGSDDRDSFILDFEWDFYRRNLEIGILLRGDASRGTDEQKRGEKRAGESSDISNGLGEIA